MTWKQLCKLARELPEVTEDFWFGTPALKVRDKSFARLKEDGKTIVLMVEDLDEQEALVATKARVFFITDHYRGYPAVLARLSTLGVREARVRLERAWRKKAPRKLVAQLDAA